MATKTETKPQNNVPSGYKQTGTGSLPPFFALPREGQDLYAVVNEVRAVKRAEKVKVKGKIEEVEKVKYYFDLTLTEEATGDDASRLHTPVTHPIGKRVTVSNGGNLLRGFQEAAVVAMGKSVEDLKSDPDMDIAWDVLKGLNVYIRREADGKMGKTSAFPGNKVTKYTVAFKDLPNTSK